MTDASIFFNSFFVLPKIVIEGFNLPSVLNNGGFSILANGLFGSGSLGVPSTRAQHPITEPRPTNFQKLIITLYYCVKS